MRLTGQVPPRGSRPVVLQRKSGSRWLEVASRSTVEGRFSFSITTRATSTTYRVKAASARVNGRLYPTVTTPRPA